MDAIRNKQKNLYVCVGIPGCGKSSWAAKQENAVWISRDKIRFSIIHDDDAYFAHEDEVFYQFIKAIQKGLDEGHDVIADATHLNPGSRNKLLDKLNLDGVKLIAVNFTASFITCVERNEQRQGRACVPYNVLKSMFRDYRDPENDTKHIFDNILDVDARGIETVRC